MLIFTLLMFLGTAAYLQVGFQLGRIGWDAWVLKRRSTASFILFPVRWQRDVIGLAESPIFEGVNPPQGVYRAAMLVFWPLLLCWSAIIIGTVVGPARLIQRLTSKESEKVRISAQLERLNLQLEEESRQLDKLIWEAESETEQENARTHVG